MAYNFFSTVSKFLSFTWFAVVCTLTLIFSQELQSFDTEKENNTWVQISIVHAALAAVTERPRGLRCWRKHSRLQSLFLCGCFPM